MVDAKVLPSSDGESSMVGELAPLSIPSSPTAGPPLLPESLFASKFKASRVMHAVLFVVSIRLEFRITAPVEAFHLQFLFNPTISLLGLLLDLIWHFARIPMLELVWRKYGELGLHSQLLLSHLMGVSVEQGNAEKLISDLLTMWEAASIRLPEDAVSLLLISLGPEA